MLRHDFLVGGYDMLAERYALEDVVERGLLAAHDLDDDVHIGVVEDVVGAGGERAVWQACGALPCRGRARARREGLRARLSSLPAARPLSVTDACYAAADHAHA